MVRKPDVGVLSPNAMGRFSIPAQIGSQPTRSTAALVIALMSGSAAMRTCPSDCSAQNRRICLRSATWAEPSMSCANRRSAPSSRRRRSVPPDVAPVRGHESRHLAQPLQRLPCAEQAAQVRESQYRSCGRSPQNPHKSGSAGWLPTRNPRTRWHSPPHGGTVATMALPLLIGLYAGSAGLARWIAPVVRAATGLLVSGRSAVRIRSPAPRYMKVLRLLARDLVERAVERMSGGRLSGGRSVRRAI